MFKGVGSAGMIIILGILALNFISCVVAMVCLCCNCLFIG